MTSRRTALVSIAAALVAVWFAYDAWFTPQGAVERRLHALAADLSVPADAGSDMDRLARIARLRGYFAPDVRVTAGRSGRTLESRDTLLGAVAAWKAPSGGWEVRVADVVVTMEPPGAARAHLTVEVIGRDPRTGESTFDARELRARLVDADGTWVIAAADLVETLQHP